MRLREAVLIESPVSDFQQRDLARMALRDLIQSLERLGWEDGAEVMSSGALAFRAHRLRHPLKISFIVHQKTGREVAAINPDQRSVHVFLDLDRSMRDQMMSRQTSGALIHELVHILDSDRMTHMGTPGRDDEDYYNHPVEFNAFYQEALHAWDEWFENVFGQAGLPARTAASRHLDSYQAWESFMLNTKFDKGFVRNLTQENTRRLKRRLFKHWDEEVRDRL